MITTAPAPAYYTHALPQVEVVLLEPLLCNSCRGLGFRYRRTDPIPERVTCETCLGRPVLPIGSSLFFDVWVRSDRYGVYPALQVGVAVAYPWASDHRARHRMFCAHSLAFGAHTLEYTMLRAVCEALRSGAGVADEPLLHSEIRVTDAVEWPADLPLAHSWHDWQDVRTLTIARMDQPWISFGGEQ